MPLATPLAGTRRPQTRGVLGVAVRRGILAGFIGGLLAGLFALVVAGPPLDAAIALEGAAAGAAASEEGLSRLTQRIGLLVGTGVFGMAVGAAFGVASAFAVGRLAGSDWTRSLKLAGMATAALVVLPVLAYPPNPPAVGDPNTVGVRSGLYLLTAVLGVALALGAGELRRALRRRNVADSTAQVVTIAFLAIALTILLVFRPQAGGASDFPAELLWRFRLGSLGTQVVLWCGMGMAYGWLADRAPTDRPMVPVA